MGMATSQGSKPAGTQERRVRSAIGGGGGGVVRVITFCHEVLQVSRQRGEVSKKRGSSQQVRGAIRSAGRGVIIMAAKCGAQVNRSGGPSGRQAGE